MGALELGGFVPEKIKPTEVKLQTELVDVVGRICQVLPPEVVWKMFSSSGTETGKVIKFPYLRVDSGLVLIRDVLASIEKKPSEENYQKKYARASIMAMRVLVWVEVGFEGLQNLANRPEAIKWSSKERIMTEGKQIYKEVLEKFVRLRQKHQITDDCFSQYRLEYLLPKIES